MDTDESGSLVAALKAAAATWPEQRLGQLIDNAVADHDRAPLFHISNADLLTALYDYGRAKA